MGRDHEFLEAARNGNIAVVEKFLNQKSKKNGPLASLRRGPGVNVQDSNGYSALHHAALNGHIDIVKLLLAHDASANLPDSRGSSPLHLAGWAGHQEIVKIFLTHPYNPANVNLQTIEKETPLHCAAQYGHTGALTTLLAHGGDPNMTNCRNETPLDLAAQYGRLQAVQMLIRAHPELLLPYKNSFHSLENNENSSFCINKIQIGGGVSGNICNSNNGSIISNGTSNVNGGGNNICSGGGFGGGFSGNSRCNSRSSQASSSFNTDTSSGNYIKNSNIVTNTSLHLHTHTPLHLASRNGHKNVVEVLLAAGIDVNILTPSGTALHEAALCGKDNVVRTLLDSGADLDATDSEGRTPLDILEEFPPHVTRSIVSVINNYKKSLTYDSESDDVHRCNQKSMI
ncbi:ankyrin repeat and sterile alpha motif domain-containing protein 1B-like isoform X2 [Condylostylus longicornis]|uniref:ankyrin repeat and sterile alpha motif domain-containing protein 1B-like isoform X2 n=1 Tax=Condylostylus longicornis TaxID=2530218 RepID=UPI00244E035F|nr:ankyrin repeat and sterile alpha motif domain-containing protein 1B-like isoform X2 [Condylostylus longicornis]